MRIQQQSTLNAGTSIVSQDTTTANQTSSVITDITNLRLAINGNLRFGDPNSGQNGENIDGQWVTFLTSGTANASFAVSHTVGVPPIGFIVTKLDKGAIIYASGTSWTGSTVYLNSTIANTTATIFLLM